MATSGRKVHAVMFSLYFYCECNFTLPMISRSSALSWGNITHWELHVLGYYAASSGNLPAFRDNLSDPIIRVHESFGFLLDCALLGYDSASSGNFLPAFRDNLSVPSSGFRNLLDSCWTALFWVIMQRVVEISYWRFEITYRSHLQGSGIFWILVGLLFSGLWLNE